MDSTSNITSNNTLLYGQDDGELGKLVRNIEIAHRIIIIVLGSIGNCLSVVIFSSKHLRHLSSSFYLSALAVSDTGFLIVLFINWLQGIGLDILLEDVYCRLQMYWTNVFGFLSVWFVVAFTVERFIAVQYPLLRPSMCTVSRARAVILVLFIISLVMFAPSLTTVFEIVYINETDSSTCAPTEISNVDNVMMYLDLVIVMVVPCIGIISINTCICMTVHRLSRTRRKMTLNGRRGQHELTRVQPQGSNSQNKVTRLLLVVSSVFVCLNLPFYVLRLCVFLPDVSNYLDASVSFRVVQRISLALYYTNFGINFVLYCVTGQNFRNSLLGLFFSKGLRHQDTTRITVVSECGRAPSTRRRMIPLNGSLTESHEMVPLTRTTE